MSYHFWVIFRTPSVKSQWKCSEPQKNLCNLVLKKQKIWKKKEAVYTSNKIKENKHRYIWLNKKLPQEFFVGRKDLLEEENYQIIKIIIYKCIHKYKKRFANFSPNCFIKDVN